MVQKRLCAMIMAGGRSQRMRRGGRSCHKGLREILGAPLIEWNLSALLWFGFTQVYVAVSGCEPELTQWLLEKGTALAKERDADLIILVEDKPLGTIGAAGRILADVTDLVIVNVDNLTELNLLALLKFHRDQAAAMTVATHEQVINLPFGRLRLEGDRLTGYDEKPNIPVQISSGTYVLNQRVFGAIQPDCRTDVPVLCARLVQRGEYVAAYRHAAVWIDVNDESSLLDAEALVAARHAKWPVLNRTP
jgi:NDP-sugar pyrophosphorylase family protein